MINLRPKWKLLSVILGVAAFLAAFGVAMAAVVQVSQQVPSNLSVLEVSVLADENLHLSFDPDGNETVNELQFNFAQLQPPLQNSGFPGRRIYIRNDSDPGIGLRLIEPCREVFLNDDPNEMRLGHMSAEFFSVENPDEHLGHSCDRGLVLEPGQTVRADIRIHDFDPGVPLGDYPFTTVVGALGQTEE